MKNKPEGIDGFTAETLLDLATSSSKESSTEMVADLVKEMKEKAPTGEAVLKSIKEAQKLGFRKKTKVTLKGDEEVGEVIGFNETTDGFYPGDRYPIIVKFARGTFEYGPESLEIVN